MERECLNSPNRMRDQEAFYYVLNKEVDTYHNSKEREDLEQSIKKVCEFLGLNDKAPDSAMDILDILFENHIKSKLELGE